MVLIVLIVPGNEGSDIDETVSGFAERTIQLVVVPERQILAPTAEGFWRVPELIGCRFRLVECGFARQTLTDPLTQRHAAPTGDLGRAPLQFFR